MVQQCTYLCPHQTASPAVLIFRITCFLEFDYDLILKKKKRTTASWKLVPPTPHPRRLPILCSGLWLRYMILVIRIKFSVGPNSLKASLLFSPEYGKEYIVYDAVFSFRSWRKIAKSDHRVCLWVRVEQVGSHLADFYDIWYLSSCQKSVEKIQVSLVSNNNNGYFARRPLYIYIYI